jgi:periplasmic divalent cation tolerance protein
MARSSKQKASDSSLVHIETTMDSESAVHRLIGVVLAQRMAACAQVATIRSKYWWEGRIEEASEFLVVFKTTPERHEELIATIEEQHPHEVPYIASTVMTEVPKAYADWLGNETSMRTQ